MKVRIEELSPDGRGRVSLAKQRVALVAQALPGELVTMRADRTTRGAVQGRVAQLLEASEERVETPCEQAFRCTGCALLGASEAFESRFKQDALQALLGSIGVNPKLLRWLEPVGRFGYRSSAKRIYGPVREGAAFGAYIQGTHDLASDAGCPVLIPRLTGVMGAIDEAVQRFRPEPSRGKKGGLAHLLARYGSVDDAVVLALVGTGENAVAAGRFARELWSERPEGLAGILAVEGKGGNVLGRGEVRATHGEASVRERVLGFEHAVDPLRFFQVAPQAAEALFEVAAAWSRELGGPVLEGYSGQGALTLPIAADGGPEVLAVESDLRAVEELGAAAARVGLSDRVLGFAGDFGELAPGLLQQRSPRCVVLDPPRAGPDEDALNAIADCDSVRRVVLLACGRESLPRDAQILGQAGFRVGAALGVDLFPRTVHAELALRFDR